MTGDPSFLYVEDDPLSREVMRIGLKNVMGYDKVWVFEDTTDFEARLSALGIVPDVFLLDIHMRPLNGFDVLKLLRESKVYSQSRIVALTASVMSEEVQMLKDSGFDGGIAKPIDPATLPDLIHQILAGEKVWYISF
jgi:CheY-like chemotaxis protein